MADDDFRRLVRSLARAELRKTRVPVADGPCSCKPLPLSAQLEALQKVDALQQRWRYEDETRRRQQDEFDSQMLELQLQIEQQNIAMMNAVMYIGFNPNPDPQVAAMLVKAATASPSQ